MSNAKKTLESSIISGMIESQLPFLRITHADKMVPAMMKEIFHPSVVWAVREYLKEIEQYETESDDHYRATMR